MECGDGGRAGVAKPVQLDFMPTYAAHLRHLIMEGVDHPNSFSQPLKGMKVVVDAGNGSGGFFKSLVGSPPPSTKCLTL